MNFNVSVVIPTYKRAQKLGRAINSVLEQTYKDIQIIVVDDNSEGDEFRKITETLMMEYTNNHRVIYLKHFKNKNGSAARNTGIRFSKSKFIAFLDDDDYFLPEKIEKQLDLLEKSSNCYGGVCCGRNAMYKQFTYHKNNLVISENGNYLVSLLNGENILSAGSTLMVRYDVFNRIGLFDESFKRHQDYEFLIRFFREFKLCVLNEHLSCICVDGIRNYPNSTLFHSIKSAFFNKFNDDIMILPEKKLASIMVNQWSEVFLYYFIEFKFKEARLIYNKNIKPHKINVGVFFIIKCIYSLIEKKIKFLLPLKYMISSLRYHKVFNNIIISSSNNV